MIGITNIGSYIAPEKVNTLEQVDTFRVSRPFIEQKIGITAVARKSASIRASDLCVAAYRDLVTAVGEAVVEDVDFLCVCTQNGDYRLPQTSAIVQQKLGLPSTCAAFDIALGCSGYVYSLHVAKSFMESGEMHKGLLFTADPYSEIIDPQDKNTALIFGDGASVTLMTADPVLDIGKGAFATHGDMHDSLIKRENEWLSMNGRSIFNFSMLHVPSGCGGVSDRKRDREGNRRSFFVSSGQPIRRRQHGPTNRAGSAENTLYGQRLRQYGFI